MPASAIAESVPLPLSSNTPITIAAEFPSLAVNGACNGCHVVATIDTKTFFDIETSHSGSRISVAGQFTFGTKRLVPEYVRSGVQEMKH